MAFTTRFNLVLVIEYTENLTNKYGKYVCMSTICKLEVYYMPDRYSSKMRNVRWEFYSFPDGWLFGPGPKPAK